MEYYYIIIDDKNYIWSNYLITNEEEAKLVKRYIQECLKEKKDNKITLKIIRVKGD